MTTLLTQTATFMDDRINPIVIKELRQAIQGRFVAAVLVLFLLVSLLVLGGFLFISEDVATSFQAGRTALLAFQGILVATCGVFMPAYVAIRMFTERSDANTDLLFITTIPARAIIWGKLLATIILVVVIYSACLPFMTLTYLLRGIDLPSIFITVGYGFLSVISSVMLAILVACLSTRLVARVLLGLGLLGLLISSVIGTMGSSSALVFLGIGSQTDDPAFWAAVGTVVGFWLVGIGLMFVCAVALIKPPSANRAMPVRLYVLGLWLVTGMTSAIWSFSVDEEEFLVAWTVGALLLASAMMLVGVCEREHWGPRLARRIPRNPLLRFGAMLLYSGAAGGVLWAILLFGLTIGVTIGSFMLYATIHGKFNIEEELVNLMIGVPLFAYAYAMTALLIQRYLLKPVTNSTQTWILALVLLALLIAVPPLIARLAMGFSTWDSITSQTVLLANPFVLVEDRYAFGCIVFAACWAIMVTVLSLGWFIRQFINFKPLADRAKPISTEPALPAADITTHE